MSPTNPTNLGSVKLRETLDYLWRQAFGAKELDFSADPASYPGPLSH